MSSFFVIAIFGILLLVGLVLWVNQRERASAENSLDEVLRRTGGDADDTTHDASAVLVSTERGQLVHINRQARHWLGLNGGVPNLEDIARMVEPTDNFLSLFTGESQASFRVNNRWVRASSYSVPSSEGARMVLVMQELQSRQSRTEQRGETADAGRGLMDVSTAMKVINDIGETVDAAMGMEPVLQTLLDIINRALPSDAGEICIWDESRNFLEQRGWIGDTRYLLTVASHGGGYSEGEGIAGWMAEHNKPVLVSGTQDTVNTQRMMQDNPYQSAVGVPLQLGDEFVGTLTLFSDEGGVYSPEDISLLQAVSKAVATAIHNAEIYATQEQRIKDIASLQEIAEQPKGQRDATPIYKLLTERMAKLIDADMCGVLLYDDDRRALTPQLPFYGLPDHVAEMVVIPLPKNSPQRKIWEDQPYWASNDLVDEPLVEELDLKAIVDVAGIDNTAFFPMQIAGERIGIIAVSNKQSPGGFAPVDLQNLRVLSSQAAIVVENVRLYQRERRIDTELVGLQEMTHAIGTLSHESEFYAEITERIARLMDSEMCGVLLYDEQQQALISRLPFHGLDDALIEGYRIDLPPGSVMEQLWDEEDFWYSNRVPNDTLVFEAGMDELAERAGVKKTMIAVMSAGRRRIGVVQVSNKHDNADYNDKDARLLQIFAAQAAAIVENARLYREVQARVNQAERLRRVAELSSTVMTTQETFEPVLREIAELTDSDMVYVNTIDENSNTLITHPRWTYNLPIEEPIIQDLNQPGYDKIPARSGRYFMTGDNENDPRVLPGYKRAGRRFGIRSSLIVPLQVGDRLIGELGIADTRHNFYNQDVVSTMSTVAAQVASAVERLQLYEATGENLRRRVEELDAIARVSNELTLTVELDKVLKIIRDEAAKATYAGYATIVVLKPTDEWRLPDRPEMSQRVGEGDAFNGLAPVELRAISRGADPIVISDYKNHDLDGVPEHATSAAAAAILYLDQIVGVIHVYDEAPNKFDERAAGFLMTLSTKASLAYQNALLYEQQKERGERLRQRVDQLNRIFELGQMVQTSQADSTTVLEAISYSIQQSVGFDTVLMLLYNDEIGAFERAAQAGMPLDKFEESRSETIDRETLDEFFQSDYRISESYFYPIEEVEDWYVPNIDALGTSYEDNRSLNATSRKEWHDGDMLIVQIMGQGGELLGLISLDRPHDNQRPERAKIEVLEIFAHQASTMLENARLFRESQRNVEQEAQLNDMLETIAGTMELTHLTRELANGVYNLVPFDSMSLMLTNDENDAFDYLKASFNDDDELVIVEESRQSLGRTAMGDAFRQRTEMFYTAADEEDVQHYEDLRSWYDQGEESTAILPLVSGGETLGVLHFGSNRESVLTDNENRTLLVRIARLVASSVQNARLFNQAVNLQILNRSVVESIQQGIVVLDNSGRIININEFMRESYDWSDEALKQDLFEYQPDLSSYLKDDLRAVLEEGEPRELVGQTSPGLADEQVVRNFYIYPLRSGETIRGAVLLVEDVTERAELEKDIEQRANQLAALTDVSTRITASLERDEVIDLAIDEIGWIIPYTTMTMWRRNGSYMVIEGASGFEEDIPEGDIRLRITEDELIMQLVESQRVISLSGDENLPDLGLPHVAPIYSWMGVPLVNQGHVVGMLILTKDEPNSYDTRQEHHVAFAFASQVAIALANADLFEQTFERTNELGTLLEAAQQTSLTREVKDVFRTVAELMFSSLDMEDCVIMIWEEFDNELEVQFSGNRIGDADFEIPVGTRYSIADYPAREKVLKDREVVVIIDTDDEERRPPYPYELEEMAAHNAGARMMVPLVVRDEAIGLIQLEQTSNDEESITQQKVRLARALGSQVAVAIENARLTTQTNQRFDELLTINQLSQSISSTLQLEDMIPIIRDQVPQITSAEEMYLALYHPEDERITFPLAVREGGNQFVIPPRDLANDEVSYIIKRKHSLNLGADYFSIDELRRSMKITNGEGDIQNYMGVPLKSGDQVLGVLAIRNVTRKHAFTINDDRILTTIGSQLGAAIQNARLYEQVTEAAEEMEALVDQRTEELEEERDRLDTLYQITSELARTLDMEQLLERSLGMVSKAVGAQDGVIMTTDPATDALFCRAWLNPNNLIDRDNEPEDIKHHPAEGLANWLLRREDTNDNVVVVDDLETYDFWDETARQTGLRSALAVVLENNEDPLGVMVLLAQKPNAFTENHLKLLVPAATQMAASMNSADLYQLIRDQAERMGKLLRTEQEEAQKNQAILESIADGVMLADNNGEIVLFNNAAERILDLPREQALGQPVNKLAGVYGQAALKWTEMMNEWAENPDRADMVEQSITERIELGDKIISTQLSPVFINDMFLGTVSVFRDVTRDVEADRAKSQFIANVSHEFRTPLTSIKGYTDLLLMSAGNNLPESHVGFVTTIKENAERLTSLVEDVLNISKVDSGDDVMHMQMVSLHNIIPQVFDSVASRDRNQDRDLKTKVSLDDDVPEIRGDREKLIQVFSNLIDNAFNYTLEGGSIEVSVERDTDSSSVIVKVADTGVGIPEEFHSAAWRRFERHDETAVNLDVAGTGLGLSLAKEFVRLHNGDIWFDSEVGVGTTFYVKLPIEQPNYRTATLEMPRVDSETIVGD